MQFKEEALRASVNKLLPSSVRNQWKEFLEILVILARHSKLVNILLLLRYVSVSRYNFFFSRKFPLAGMKVAKVNHDAFF